MAQTQPTGEDIQEVRIPATPIERFRTVLPPDEFDDFRALMTHMAELLKGRTVWNISSTSSGGGVSEMLHVLLAYARGEGVDTRWVILEGPTEFFELTKRIHHGLHGSRPPQGSNFGESNELYEMVNERFVEHFEVLLRPDDIVMVHDPQPAGTIPLLKERGVDVVWRCHVGAEHSNEHAEEAWDFLRPYLSQADALTFTRDAYVPPWVGESEAQIIPPSIDPFAPKNNDIPNDNVRAIVRRLGVVEDPSATAPPAFRRTDGSVSHVARPARVLQERPVPADAPCVLQVSRWDPLKDMQGVMRAFADHLNNTEAHLILAGPETGTVSDDPEAKEVYDACIETWESLSRAARERVHLVALPMADLDENAAMVNALQRQATIVTQKSKREGFGLTVAEAMWKAKPVVASAVGGILEQIVDGHSGFLVDDPEDHDQFADAIARLLKDEELARTTATHAQERVRKRFLGNRHLQQYLPLIERVAS